MKYVIHNPDNLPEKELPTIFGFNNGKIGNSDWQGVIVSEDGFMLGGHICSSEGFMFGDLGIIKGNEPRHEIFRNHYPKGYKMDFVGYDDVSTHDKLQAAFRLNKGKEA